MTEIAIRRARQADLPELLSIYNHYVVHTPVTFDLEPRTLAQRQVWFDEFADTGKYQCFVAVAQDRNVLFDATDTASLTVRSLSGSFLDRYLDTVGGAALESVGAYQLEKIGIQLFDRIEGDHFTILGLPLLKLLGFLRRNGSLAA